MKRKNVLPFVFTAIAWICIFVFPFLFFPYRHDTSPFESQRFVYWLVYSNIFLMVFYFANSRIFIPKLLAKKKVLLYVLVIVGSLLLFLFFFHLISIYSEETRLFIERRRRRALKGGIRYIPANPWHSFFAAGTISLFLIAYIFSTLSKIITEWFNAEQKKEAITKQQLATELHLLRSQVNPHFLFNTLNGIYSMSIANDSHTSDAVMKLSRIMRYTLEESQTDTVELSKEVEFIKSYIDLQKIRANDKLRIQLLIDKGLDNILIPPLLFIPFIENAFKYGVSAHYDSTIKISLQLQEGHLFFTCSNDIIDNQQNKTSTGMGITNARRRLDLLYENRHLLVIKKVNKIHMVELTIFI